MLLLASTAVSNTYLVSFYFLCIEESEQGILKWTLKANSCYVVKQACFGSGPAAYVQRHWFELPVCIASIYSRMRS
jgi:hypothetical protein